MNFNYIKKYIDNWDPVDLLLNSPIDEYDNEVKRILDLFETGNDLGKIIFDVFSDSFGTVSFTKSIDECNELAEKILNEN